MHRPARLGLLISGSGRSALNILDACERGHLDARVALVVAHREEVEGVARCRARGMRVAVVPTGPNLEDRVDACLEASSTDDTSRTASMPASRRRRSTSFALRGTSAASGWTNGGRAVH